MPIKIYSVIFLKYTDSTRSMVWNREDDIYINVSEPFLIREQDIAYYEKFGDGFRSLTFVGYLNDPVAKKA